MTLRIALIALTLAAGCGKSNPADPAKDDSPPPAPTAARPEKPATTAATPGDAAPVIDLEGFARELDRGRALDKQGDLAGAIAAYEAALAANPNQPAALSELGWSAFKAGQLDRAKAATEAAVAHSDDAKVKASSLYNLGRILERLDQWPAARAAYAKSQALRPHRVVKARLELIEDRLATPEPLRPLFLTGPFASLDELCHDWRKPAQSAPDRSCDFTERTARSDGFGEARILTAGPDDAGDDQTMIVISTKAGMYVSASLSQPAEVHSRSFGVVSLSLPDTAKQRTLRVDTTQTETWREDEGGWAEEITRAAVFCGVGTSGIPSCTPLVPLSGGGDRPDLDKPDFPDSLTAELRSATSLRITASGKGIDEPSRALLGTHRLTFP